MIILPDVWELPTGSTFVGGKKDFTTNVYSYTQWHLMEAVGTVFLPAAGYRCRTSVDDVGSYGYYWSSSYYYDQAYYLLFYSGYVYPQVSNSRYYGLSVRLVR